MTEGTVPFLDGAETWYRVTGELSEEGPAPLVVLHGGPGAAHDHLLSHMPHVEERERYMHLVGDWLAPQD